MSETDRNESPKKDLSPKAFRLLFVGLSVLSVVPFWTCRYPVLADYPQHLARWFVLYRIDDPAFRFSSYYSLDWGPYPYVLTDVLGVLLQRIFSIDIAGRCVLSICVLSVPFAALYFLRKAAPGNVALALLGFLIAFNPTMLMGFLESTLSLGLCVLVVGLWVSFCAAPKLETGLALSAGIVLVYLAHLIGFALAGLTMGFYCLVQKKPWTRLLELGLISVPTLVLFAHNLKPSPAGGGLVYSGFIAWSKFRNLFFPFRVYSRTEDLIIITGLAVLLFLLFRSQREIRWQKAWIIVCVLLLVIYLAVPGEYGWVGFIDVRVLLLVYLMALATVRLKNMSWITSALLVLLVLFRIATVELLFASKQQDLEARTAAFQVIPSGARVFPIVQFGAEGTLVGNAAVHHVDYGVIRNGFLVPTICYLPGFQPLRATGAGYCPNLFCEVVNPENADWSRVAKSYDYLWVDTFPAAIPYANSIADRVFSDGRVTVYRVRRPPGTVPR